MERSVFEERIRTRAKKVLIKDLYDMATAQNQARSFAGEKDVIQEEEKVLRVDYRHSGDHKIIGAYTQQVFDKKLPEYEAKVVDEILQTVDNVAWLVNSKRSADGDD